MSLSGNLNETERVAYDYSQKVLERWAKLSINNRDKATTLLGTLQHLVTRRRSSNVNISDCLRQLKTFTSDYGTYSTVTVSHSRKIFYELSFLIRLSEEIYVQPIRGTVNARTKCAFFVQEKPVRISVHAVARLIERLKTIDDSDLLNQIFNACHLASNWELSATKVGATCWPALSRDGLFIVAHEESQATTLITWLKLDGISTKWGRIAKSLSELAATNPLLLRDGEFQMAFMAAHPFMTVKDRPANPTDQNMEFVRQVEDEDELIAGDPVDISNQKKYLIGLNYLDDLPEITLQEIQSAIVVTVCPQGMTIVRLANGLIGQIPLSLTSRAIANGLDNSFFDIGNRLEVLIVRIQKLADLRAYRLIVEPKTLRDQTWSDAISAYPIGCHLSGTFSGKSENKYFIHIGAGVRGFVPATAKGQNLSASSLATLVNSNSPIEFKVVEHDHDRQLLHLSVAHSSESLALDPNAYQTGELMVCQCSYVKENFAILRTEIGATGILHQAENWGRPLPKVDETIQVVISRIGVAGLEFEGIPPHFVTQVFRLADAKRALVSDERPLQESVITRVQIRGWLSASYRVLVHTECGCAALIPWKETSWYVAKPEDAKDIFKIGDIIQAKVIKILENEGKGPKIIVSVRALQPNPLNELIEQSPIGCIFDGRIVKKVDYGYFVQLSPSNVTALMHKSHTHSGTNTGHEVGAHLKVQVMEVDAEKGRIALGEF